MRERRTISIPLTGTEWAYLQAAWPISYEDWEQMVHVLEVMKPGLVPLESLPTDVPEGPALRRDDG